MDDSQKPEEQKPLRHVFNAKAFRWYSVELLLLSFLSLAIQLLAIVTIPYYDKDLLWHYLRAVMPAFWFAVAAGSFIVMLRTLKGSDVFTSPGCVLYRRRRFFISQSKGICYIVYCITRVRRVYVNKKDSVVVEGDIDAANVMRDGITIHSAKKLRKVSIPPCFTDMETIRQTLLNMEAETLLSEKPAGRKGSARIKKEDTYQSL